MPEYPETVAQATSSRRMSAAHVRVPRGNPAGRSITFEEENLIVIGAKTIAQDVGGVAGLLVPADTFPILNPNTGAATGQTATHLDLYRLLYSLYMDLAAKRDAAAPSS